MKKNAKLVLAILGILAMGALAYNVFTYSQLTKKQLAAQYDDQVMDRLIEVANMRTLLLQLESGDTNVTRQMLTVHLKDELSKLNELKASSSAPVTETIDVLSRVVAKSPKAGEYKLSLAQSTPQQ
jgi:acyl-CoA synthetase (AMP-forming)/AMP-acid ligase II